MASEPQRCALPGCDVLIESPEDGSAQRKYCCTQHRFAARRLRSSARATDQDTAPAAVASQGRPAVDPDAAWRRRVRIAIDRAIHGITTGVPSDNGLFDPSSVTGPSATTPVERVIAELTHTIDRSVMARALRRRRRPDRRPVRRTPHGVPRRRPSPPPRKPAVRRTSALSNPTKRRPVTAAQRRLRRRAGVMVAAIAFVAMGTWLVTVHPWTGGSGPAPSVAEAQLPQVPGLPANSDQWADSAQLALTSVDQQLTEATKAEQAWQSSATARQQPTEPPAVTELHNQITSLRQEHDRLQSALNTWHAAAQAHDALTATGTQYSAVAQPRSTPTAVTAGPRLPEPTTARNPAVQEQSLASQAARQREQLDSLLSQVQNNMTAPLPATTDGIGGLVNSVLDLTQQQPRPTRPATHQPTTRPTAPTPSAPKPPATQPSTATRAPQPTGATSQPVPPTPTSLVPVVLPTQPAPVRPVTLVPVLVPKPPVVGTATVYTKPTVSAQPTAPLPQPSQPVPAAPSQSQLDSLAALRDLEAMSTLAAAAQQAPEGSAEKRRLGEEAAAGVIQAMARHLNALVADAASVNNSGESYGADGANAD